ncbi:MAG: PQQ-dependent sugar dehydrogenase [Aquabacterium sp.]
MRTYRNMVGAAVVSLVGASTLTWATQAQALEGKVVATGLAQPLYLTAPVGDDRLFIVEKGGAIRLWSQGSVQATPFLDLSTRIDTAGERGLLGLAFDPGYAANGRFYVNYIDATTKQTVVDRYTVDPTASQATGATVDRIITIDQTTFSNHKAGWIAFRPNDPGRLYIATGDGGGSYDPGNNGQNPNSLLGKMLRVDVSGAGAGYTVPGDNPFVGAAGHAPEIWATGLRNPWRNSFDRQTGDLWIADVGQDTREEINFEAAGTAGGRNYGWRLREGLVATPSVGGNAPGLTDPIFDYTRVEQGGLGNSITGGYVYRGPSVADADGRYFFGDFISNRVFSFQLDGTSHPTDFREDTDALLTGTGLQNIASFGEDGHGRLYLVGLNGTVVAVVPEPSAGWLALAGLLCVHPLSRLRTCRKHANEANSA